jgi:uncharacterized protein YbgA (DUF1722 family)/uncharacterized protein YbbK (DUF523 family)
VDLRNKPERVRIGISACLLGEKVRYDGGHKKDRFLVDLFGKYVEWVPVCPEVEMGLPIPRDNLRLIEEGGELRLFAPKTATDYTAQMKRFARGRVNELVREDIVGFVFKRASPSCGLQQVRVYKKGVPGPRSPGLFAREFTRSLPTLPVEEEGRLNDPRLRENFVSRVFAQHRWSEMSKQRLTRGLLTEFHAAHKFVLMAHSQAGLRRLGALLGRASRSSNVRELADRYFAEFSTVMQRTPTRKNHTNTLQHVAGYLGDRLDANDRKELAETIENYRLGRLPLIVPITLLRHYVRKFNVPYIDKQVYLAPHPDELMLLNQL